LHAQRQRAAAPRFHDQVQVIALYGEMHEAKTKALTACSQRKAYSAEELPAT
jgi:hypothetical protein